MAGRRRAAPAHKMRRPEQEAEEAAEGAARQPWTPPPVAELIARIEAALRPRDPD